MQYVRGNLALKELKKEREAKIVEDLARQLEDFYREGLSHNMTEAEADAYARVPISPQWRMNFCCTGESAMALFLIFLL